MFSFGFNVKPRKAGGVSYDADAQAFFTAASITDTTQKNAVNQLVLDLKSYGVWTKCNAIYPIVGGSASSHAVNLKTPGTYNLSFATGMTHSSTGMVSNGTSGYGNTSLSTSVIGLNTGHLSYYSRTNNASSVVEIGAYKSTVPQSYTDIGAKYGASGAYYRHNFQVAASFVANADSSGFYNGNRTASNVIKLFKNGTSIQSLTTLANSTTTFSIYICAVNNAGTAASYSNRECAFASIGTGLTDTEAANYYTAVQAYQTTLSRQV